MSSQPVNTGTPCHYPQSNPNLVMAGSVGPSRAGTSTPLYVHRYALMNVMTQQESVASGLQVPTGDDDEGSDPQQARNTIDSTVPTTALGLH